MTFGQRGEGDEVFSSQHASRNNIPDREEREQSISGGVYCAEEFAWSGVSRGRQRRWDKGGLEGEVLGRSWKASFAIVEPRVYFEKNEKLLQSCEHRMIPSDFWTQGFLMD